MQRRQPSLQIAVRYALRHPATAFRLATEDRHRVATIALAAMPGPLRRRAAGLLGGLASAIARRPGEHPRAIRLLALAMDARGDRAGALRVVVAAADGATSSTAMRLARTALDLGDIGLADKLMPPSASSSPRERELRTRIAFAAGRYREARERIGSGRRARMGRFADLARRLDGELALLDPAWQPKSLKAAPSGTGKPTASSGSPTILHLLTNSLPYRQAGYTLRAQAVAQCQRAVGLDPQMVTRAGFPGNEGIVDAQRADVVDGITYHRIRPDLPPDTRPDQVADKTAAGLVRLAASLRPVALQPTTNYANAQAALAAGRRLGIPVVYEVRGFLEETWLSGFGESMAGEAAVSAALESDRYVMTREIETSCMLRADAIVTLSETMRAEMATRGVDPSHVTVIPNAVDIDRFTPGPRDEALAASLGIKPTETVVGYVSSLVPYEGVGYLIDAVAQLAAAGKAVRLVIVGDGVALPALKGQAAELGLVDNQVAIFTGRVPFADVERYYRLIDIFVVPRTNDRVSRLVTPLKPYEAMAMERAMVVSDIPALVEIVTDGVTGRVFPAEDPTALAGVIDSLLADPAERRRLGAAARAWVAEHRTWAGNGQRYLELYQRLGIARPVSRSTSAR